MCSALQLGDAVEGELHVGAAEEADTEADVGAGVAEDADYLGCAVGLVEVLDADVFAYGEVCCGEADVEVFLHEHLPEELHVFVADSCQCVPSALAVFLPGGVVHERDDARTTFDVLPFGFRHADEDDGRDKDFLNSSALASAPDMCLVDGGDECFDAVTDETLADCLLCLRPHPEYVPCLFCRVLALRGCFCCVVLMDFWHGSAAVSGCR